MRILIVDDEEQACRALKNMIGFYLPELEVVGMSHSVKDGVEAVLKLHPDLVLLDVQMADGSGFDLLKRIRKLDFRVIFVTAHEHYAIQAIRMSALDYLLKPVNPEELIAAITKAEKKDWEESIPSRLEALGDNLHKAGKLILNTASTIYALDLGDIVRFEAEQNYTHIYTITPERITATRTLKEFDMMLSQGFFFRAHQSHLVNLNFVDRIEKTNGGQILLKNGVRIPLSVRKKELLLEALKRL